MATGTMNRRVFLGSAAAGAALAVSGTLAGALAAGETGKKMPAVFVCTICGHVEFGAAPDRCPVCHQPKEKFTSNDTLFADVIASNKGLDASHEPVITVTKKTVLIHEQPTDEVKVRIGKKLHPMEPDHWIMWMDCYVDDRFIARISMSQGSQPAAAFFPKPAGTKVRIVEHCSKHGHWQAEAAL